MKRHAIFILFCVGILALILGAVVSGFAINEIYFLRPTKDAPVISLTVKTGERAADVTQKLVEFRLVSSPLLFKVYLRTRRLEGAIKTGTFTIARGTNMHELVRLLTTDGQNDITITVLEGWGIREIAAYLEEQGFSKQEFLDTVKISISAITWLPEKPAGISLEGFLFPDTYRITRGAKQENIIQKMLAAFQRKVYEPYGATRYRGHTFYETLIMASIIEREVRGPEDRKKVADIFWRRLDIGMALQADSTVNYVTGKKTPAISAEDRALDSPYNTYRVRGLPPTPINNPGLLAIRAALEPTPNEYWYFLTDTEGGVHYAVTLEEHNENKTRYLK